MREVEFNFLDSSEAIEAIPQLNLLAHAQILEKSLRSKCGGHCECGTCRIFIVSGGVNPVGLEERKLLSRIDVKAIQNLKKELKITKGELRLACQCFPSTEGTDLICVWVPHKSAPDLRNT